jgi:S-adenosylmethionine hydrolase
VRPPVVSFLSDYGLADDFVGVCHGVIASICPQARVIDISHNVPRHDVRAGAILLRGSLPYMPDGVHMAVVDPDVGAARRAVALRVAADDRLLVGPDNGLLMPAAEAFGGVVEAIDISHSEFRLEPVSATFHGRDLFAPVAAQLVRGAPLADAGIPVDVAELVGLPLPGSSVSGGVLTAHVLYVDHFGNAQLSVGHEDLAGVGLRLGRPVELIVGTERFDAVFAHTFADVPAGGLLVYEDAHRTLALAVGKGSAAELLGIGPDAAVGLCAP